jgi:hypothetical protein
MATGAAAARINAMIDTAVGLGTYIQLHVGSPGASGTSNVATNTTRQQATMGSASGGQAVSTADLTWTSVPADEDYTHFSMWTASSGGTFLWSGTITANAVTTGDTFKIASGNLVLAYPAAS